MRDWVQCWLWPSCRAAMREPTFIPGRWQKNSVEWGEGLLRVPSSSPSTSRQAWHQELSQSYQSKPLSSTPPPWLISWQPLQGNEAGPFFLN